MNWTPSFKTGSTNSFTPVFKSQIQRFLPSGKNVVSGIILPVHDWEPGKYKVGSREWAESYISYRNASVPDEKGHPSVLVPCATIRLHTRVGPKEDDFVSPVSRAYLMQTEGENPQLSDPLIDIIEVAKQENSPYKKLTEEGSGKSGYALLSYPSLKCLFNVVALNAKDAGQQPKSGVLFMPKAAHPEFIRLMNIPRMGSQVPQPRDPDWPDYLYGDVCNPNRPLEFRTIQRSNPANEHNKFQGWMFSSNEVSLLGAANAPVIPKELLANRLNLFDPAVYNILSYQELVDRILADPWLPMDLIRQACSNKANIGGTQQMGIPNPLGAQQPAYTAPQQTYAAPQQQPAPYNPQPSYPLPTESIPMQHKYWYNGPVGVVLVERGVIQTAMAVTVGDDPMVMPEDQSGGWVKASSMGFVVTQPPAPAPAPYTPPPQAAPAPYTPPQAAPAPYTPPPQAATPAPYTPPQAAQAPYTPPMTTADAPWDAAAPAPAPAASAGVSPELAALPYYAEFAAKSKSELSEYIADAMRKLAGGSLDTEGMKRMQTAGALHTVV